MSGRALSLKPVRSLAVEAVGNQFRAEQRKPGIRLKGRWLAAAGFAPGTRAEIVQTAPGVLTIRAIGGVQ